jgi:hypothetical protein
MRFRIVVCEIAHTKESELHPKIGATLNREAKNLFVPSTGGSYEPKFSETAITTPLPATAEPA